MIVFCCRRSGQKERLGEWARPGPVRPEQSQLQGLGCYSIKVRTGHPKVGAEHTKGKS